LDFNNLIVPRITEVNVLVHFLSYTFKRNRNTLLNE